MPKINYIACKNSLAVVVAAVNSVLVAAIVATVVAAVFTVVVARALPAVFADVADVPNC